MISQKTVTFYGWITLGILLVLLVLVWTGQIGAELRLTVLVIAGLLVISRVVLRLLSARKKSNRGEGSG